MSENESQNETSPPEPGGEDPKIALERLNTALQTAEQSLANYGASLKKAEAEILDLKSKLVQANKAKLEAEVDRDQKVANLDAARRKADVEKRRAVARGQEQQQELDRLRRSNKELERRVGALDEEPDPAFDVESSEEEHEANNAALEGDDAND